MLFNGIKLFIIFMILTFIRLKSFQNIKSAIKINPRYFSLSQFKNNYNYISSESNEKIKHICSIKTRKKKDLQNLIFLEGHRVILDALAAGFIPEQIFLTERGTEAPLGGALVKALNKYQSNVFTVTDNVMSKITETVTSQGQY